MFERLKQSYKENKIYFIGAIVLIAIVIILFIVGLVTLNVEKAKPEPLENDESTEKLIEEIQQTHAPLLLKNLTFFSDFIGSKGGTDALNLLADSVLEGTEPLENDSLYGTAAGKTIQKGVSFPYDTLYFTLNISNDANDAYYVQVAKVNEAYYGLLVTRTYPKSETSNFFIVFLQDETTGNYKRKTAIDGLTKWAKSQTKNKLVLTTKSL